MFKKLALIVALFAVAGQVQAAKPQSEGYITKAGKVGFAVLSGVNTVASNGLGYKGLINKEGFAKMKKDSETVYNKYEIARSTVNVASRLAIFTRLGAIAKQVYKAEKGKKLETLRKALREDRVLQGATAVALITEAVHQGLVKELHQQQYNG